jgi:nickel-type superoxide dismutase maturation protease
VVILTGSAAAIIACLARAVRIQRFEIEGPSMIPALDHGDRVLLRRVRRLRVGDIVVVADPEANERWLAKRIAAASGAEFWVTGDNAGASRDSRAFGAIHRDAVRGVVWYRYFPTDQAGRVRSSPAEYKGEHRGRRRWSRRSAALSATAGTLA